jgi:peptidoglycan/LPS O-acetylase OafA/YrhL
MTIKPDKEAAVDVPTKQSKLARSKDWEILSGLRFYLAVVVLFAHCRLLISDVRYAPKLIYIGALLGGPPSVYGFFLVSGYSIAASICQEAHGFYRRRIARIYPVYLACFALALVAFAVVGSPFKMEFGTVLEYDGRWWVILMNAIGLPCILAGAVGTFGPSWSLTCEIIYYSLAPVLKRCSTKLLLFFIFASYLFFAINHGNGWAFLQHGQAVFGLAWFWLAGFVFFRHRANRLATPIFIAFIIAGYTRNWNGAEPLAAFNIMVSVLAIVYTTEINLPSGVGRILVYLGEISYPLYLVHFPIYVMIFGCFRNVLEPHPITIVLYPICAIVSSIFVYHFIDRPSRKFILEKFGFRKPLVTMHASAK